MKKNLRISQNTQLNEICVFVGRFFLKSVYRNLCKFFIMRYEVCLYCYSSFLLISRLVLNILRQLFRVLDH